jgi:hypothetical protein
MEASATFNNKWPSDPLHDFHLNQFPIPWLISATQSGSSGGFIMLEVSSFSAKVRAVTRKRESLSSFDSLTTDSHF